MMHRYKMAHDLISDCLIFFFQKKEKPVNGEIGAPFPGPGKDDAFGVAIYMYLCIVTAPLDSVLMSKIAVHFLRLPHVFSNPWIGYVLRI